MLTVEEALRIARTHVEEERGYYCHVAGLLQDDDDYYIVLALNEGHLEWLLGPGPLFISKTTSEVWGDAFGNVLDKIDLMTRI